MGAASCSPCFTQFALDKLYWLFTVHCCTLCSVPFASCNTTCHGALQTVSFGHWSHNGICFVHLFSLFLLALLSNGQSWRSCYSCITVHGHHSLHSQYLHYSHTQWVGHFRLFVLVVLVVLSYDACDGQFDHSFKCLFSLVRCTSLARSSCSSFISRKLSSILV
jgi:hypothetical protein